MNKIRVAVLGCGSVAQHRHLPEYKQHDHVEIAAVCDIVEDRAAKMAQKYGARAYTDYLELLKQEAVDAVSICTPNYLHASMTVAALAAGAHVLCEKPMATSEAEGLAMIAAAQRSGKTLMIGHNQRFVPSHIKARQLIEAGELGRIYSFRTTFGHPGPEGWSQDGKDSWFFQKEKAFVGAMGDLGVHKADLIRFLLQEEITEVFSMIKGDAKEYSTVDDNAICLLQTESGIMGTLAASWVYQHEDNGTIIYGEKAILHLEMDPVHPLIIHYAHGEKIKYELPQIQTNAEGGQSDTHIIANFLKTIQGDIQNPIPGREGLNSLQVILAAVQSQAVKKLITVQTYQG